MTFGTLFSFGVFLTPIAETFGTSTGPVAPLFSGSVAFYYLAGAIGGRLGDRYGVRIMVAFGALTLTSGLLLSSIAGSLWLLYLVYVPLIGGAAGSCYSPLIGAVGHWFDRQRSMATGVLLSGVGAGTLAMPSLARFLIDGYGWRRAFVVLAVLSAVAVGQAVVFCTSPPDQAPSEGRPISIALGSRRFRRLYLSVVLMGPGFYAPFAFYNDYAVAEGIGGRAAAALIGTAGASSVVARLGFGSIGGRVNALQLYRLGYLLMTAALVAWLFAFSSYGVLVVSAVLLGLGWAAWVTAAPLVLADWFGLSDLGGLIGTFYTGLGIGAIFGPSLSGFIVDEFGYRPAVVVVVVTSLVACASLVMPMEERADGGPGRGAGLDEDAASKA